MRGQALMAFLRNPRNRRVVQAMLAGSAAGGGALGVQAGRRDDETFGEAAARMGRSALSGTQQGAAAGYADELMGDDSMHGAYREAAPVSFAVGETGGAVLPAAFGAGLVSQAMRGRGSARSRLLIAALAGAAHGGVAGSGMGEKRDVTMRDRLMGAGIGAGIGGVVGGAAVPAARAVRDIADNVPAMLGVRRLADGGTEQVAFGQGTRASAPLTVTLRGEGTPEERARLALQAGLARDEYMASTTGRGGVQIGRFADEPGGRMVTPYSGAQVGPGVRSLVDAAARSPAGAGALRSEANTLLRSSLARQLRGARATPARGRTGLATADQRELVDAFFMPEAHESFLSVIGSMTAAQRSRVATGVLRRVRADARALGLDETDAFMAQLRNPQFAQRMEALGVRMPRGPRRSGNMTPLDEAQEQALALRARAANERELEGLSPEDLALLREGTLGEEDALALLAAARQPQRAYLVRPDREARALTGAYEQGVRMQPRDWANASAEDLDRAVFAAQPATAAVMAPLHTPQQRRNALMR